MQILCTGSECSWVPFLLGGFGLLWGSFLNVCILRIPAGEDIVFKPSHCCHCGKKVRWFDNIPLVSYLILGGKCRDCRNGISVQYPLVEALTSVLLVLGWFQFGATWAFVGFFLLISNLLVISVIDLHHQIIPDELSLSGMLVGFLFVWWTQTLSWWESALGIFLGAGMFFAVAWLYEKFTGREGLGGGDVKLLGMIGAWLGYQCLLPVVVIASALGSLVGVGILLRQKGNLKTAIPFGPFLAVGAAVVLFYRDTVITFIFPPIP